MSSWKPPEMSTLKDVQLVDPAADSAMITNDENTDTTNDENATTCDTAEGDVNETEVKKNKMPRVDIKKLTKFMSQRKLRTYQAKQKAEKKSKKMGQKKKKSFKW